GIRAPGLSPTPPTAGEKRPSTSITQGAGMTAQPVTDLETKELRRRSRKAKVVAPPRAPAGLRLPKPIRRLQRNAPMYAIQGISGLSSRLREITGRDIIDMNRLMEVVQFLFQQREL